MESKLHEQFDREYDLLKRELDRAEAIQKGLQGQTNNSASNITVNAGGIGVYIAVTCCAVMLAVNILLVALIVDHSRKIDRLEDYVTATYMISGSKK